MRKEASLELWNELYELAQELEGLDPWSFLGDTDLICVVPEEDEDPLFCSITGDGEELKAICVYEGLDGLGDFALLTACDELYLPSQYVIYDQTCLFAYWGEEEDLSDENRDLIRQLEIIPDEDGCFLSFLSHNSRFRPYILNEREVTVLIEAYQNLIMAIRALSEERISVDFEKGECLYRRYNKETGTWHMSAGFLPDASKEFPEVMIDDEVLKYKLKKQPQLDVEAVMDFCYTNTIIMDDDYERPVHPLLFLAFDGANQEIMAMQVMGPEEDEIEVALNFFVSFVEQHGKMKKIQARNPWIFAALSDICEYCGITLEHRPLPLADELEEEIKKQL